MAVTVSERFSTFARNVNAASASPYATVIVFAAIVLWALSGPAFHFSDSWQLIMNTVSSIVTFMMVFILNNAQSRDTRAINIKLDELIRSIENADNRAIALEEKPVIESEQLAEAIKLAVEEVSEDAARNGSTKTVAG